MIINCPVCLTEIAAGSAYITSCGHVVCCPCLRRWRSYSNPLKCPVCMSMEIHDTENNLRPLNFCSIIRSNKIAPNYCKSSPSLFAPNYCKSSPSLLLNSSSSPPLASLNSLSSIFNSSSSSSSSLQQLINVNYELAEDYVNTEDNSCDYSNFIRCVSCHRSLDNEQSRVVFESPDSCTDSGQFCCDGYSFSSSASADSVNVFSAQIGHAFCVPCFQRSDIDKRRNSMFDSVFFCPGCRTRPTLDCVFPMFIVTGSELINNSNNAISSTAEINYNYKADSAVKSGQHLDCNYSSNWIEYNGGKINCEESGDEGSSLDCLQELYYRRPRHALFLLLRNLTCELFDCLMEMPVWDPQYSIPAPPIINY